jgi:hypothetical protein
MVKWISDGAEINNSEFFIQEQKNHREVCCEEEVEIFDEL